MELNFGTHTTEGQRIVQQLAGELGDPKDLDRARLILHAVLGALRRRLGFDRAKHLMDQLPTPLQAVFIDQWEVKSETPADLSSMEDFIVEVQKSGSYLVDFVELNDAIQAIRSVFKVVKQHISDTHYHQLISLLPGDVRDTLAGFDMKRGRMSSP